MAKFINGHISGRLGDLVFKIVNGKQIVCKPPAKSNKPKTAKYLERLDLFGFCCAMIAKINRVRIFEEHWRKTRIKAKTNFNKLLMINSPLVKSKYDITNVKLVNTSGFPCEVINFYFSFTGLSTELLLQNPFNLTNNCSLQGIILLLDPVDPEMNPYKFLHFSSMDYPYVKGENNSFTAEFNSSQTELIKAYGTANILFNAAVKNKEGFVSGFSESRFMSEQVII